MTVPFDDRQLDVLQQVVGAWPSQQLVLIGAGALGCSMDMWWRGTHDLDLVLVGRHGAAAAALRSLGLRQDPRFEHRWTADTGVHLDVLPLSEKQLAAGSLTWPRSGQVMSLVGLDLALRYNFSVPLRRGRLLSVATLPVVALLKMGAWLQQPHERGRDLSDLGYLLKDYLPTEHLRRWDDPRLSEDAFDQQGARALGLDIGAIAKTVHLQVARDFVARVADPDSAAFQQLGSAESCEGPGQAELLTERLRCLQQGIVTAVSARSRR